MLSLSTLFIPELLIVPKTERGGGREGEGGREREINFVLENGLT